MLKRNFYAFKALVILFLSLFFANALHAQVENQKSSDIRELIMKIQELAGNSQYDKALEILESFDDKSSPEVQFYLGLCYEKSSETVRDYNLAYEWYMKAAGKGHAVALNNIAVLCENGRISGISSEEVFNLYKNAADMGIANSQFVVALSYYNGGVVSQNHELAFKYFTLSASQHHAASIFYLARMHENGLGTEKNIGKAMELYERAGNLGNSIACSSLAVLYLDGKNTEKDYAKSFFWFEKASSLGNGYSALKAGTMLLNGIGIQKDEKKAVEYFNLALARCEFDANYYLGICAENGLGMEKNADDAYDYFIAGAKKNDEKCINAIKNHEGLAEYLRNLALNVHHAGQKGETEKVLKDGKKWSDIYVYGLGSDIVPDGVVIYSHLMAAYDEIGDAENSLFYAKKQCRVAEKIYGEKSVHAAISNSTLASCYFGRNDFENVILHCEKGLACASSIEKDKAEFKFAFDVITNCHRLLGESYYARHDFAKSKMNYEKALENEKKLHQENECIAMIYDGLSRLYADTDVYESLEYEKKAVSFFEKENNMRMLSPLHVNLGFLHSKLGEYESSIQYIKKGIEENEKIYGMHHAKTASQYQNLGLVYFYDNRLSEALENCLLALKIYESNKFQFLEDNLHEGLCFFYLSLIYSKMGDGKLSESYMLKSLEIFKSQSDEKSILCATSLYSLAIDLAKKGNVDEAVSVSLQALSMLPPETVDYIKCCANLCDFYLKAGNLDSALKYGNLAADICRKKNMEHDSLYFTALNNLAFVHGALGDDSKKIGILLEIYSLNSEKNGHAHPSNLTFLGNIISELLEKKDLKAFSYYDAFLECARNSCECDTVISVCSNMSNLINLSLHVYENEKKSDPRNHDILAGLFMKGFETCIKVVESARKNLSSSKNDFAKKTYPLYVAAIDFYTRENMLDRAFCVYEMSRNREFLDEIGEELAYDVANVPDVQRRKIRELEKSILNERKNLDFPTDDAEENSRHLKKLFELEKELVVIQKSISESSPKYMMLKNPEIVGFDEAKKFCSEKKAILEYILCGNDDFLLNRDVHLGYVDEKMLKSYCLVITKNKTYSVELGDASEIENQIIMLRNILVADENAQGEESINLRKKLYSGLMEKALEKLPKEIDELMIVPDSSLSSLPFDVLMDENGALLGDMYMIGISPSVSVSILSKKGNVSPKKKNVLAVGNPSYSVENDSENRGLVRKVMKKKSPVSISDFSLAGRYYSERGVTWANIPGTGVEIKKLKNDVFSGQNVMVIEGKAASESKIKELSSHGVLKDYSVIHFACHGCFDEENPEMSSVVFSEVSEGKDASDDGYLTLGEVSLLDLDADFLNLSACQTGLLHVKKGDGMTGLLRSFMVSGARNLGATLWCVDDEATCYFMTKMYGFIEKDGMSYKSAYSRTKKEFRKIEKWSSPYYWAPFVLYE